MSDNSLLEAAAFMQFLDRSDPVVNKLCSHLQTALEELAKERVLNSLIEEQLKQMGIELVSESETTPEE